MKAIEPVSILDSDLYKFTMQWFALKLFPNEIVRYEFFNRDMREFPPGFVDVLKESINNMKSLSLSTDEYNYIASFPMPQAYRDFLKDYRFDPSEVHIEQIETKLICYIEGYWYRTILWEVPLMGIISELYFQDVPTYRALQKERNFEKVRMLCDAGCHFTEFGSRRRFSRENQAQVLEDIMTVASEGLFMGTSNPYFAKKYDLSCQGTQAHELFSLMAAIYGFLQANTMAMEHWVSVYNGALGIVLPDTFRTVNFLHSFTEKYAKIFDGPRQDSGVPQIFADKFERHYQTLGIQPKEKKLLFSDALNAVKAVAIEQNYKNRFKTGYGIGTFFTNDIVNSPKKPLNIVIKLVGRLLMTHNLSRWIPTIKLSDDLGKNTGDKQMIKLCEDTFSLHYGLDNECFSCTLESASSLIELKVKVQELLIHDGQTEI
jgi:nicotinate phosphoribosyltransferase